MKKKYQCVIIVLLVVSSFVAFSPIAANEFINFDDNGYISENIQVQQGIAGDTAYEAAHTIAGSWAMATAALSAVSQ